MSKKTSGLVSAVPCPHCGHKMDFKSLIGQEQGGECLDGTVIDRGTEVDCDKCDRKSAVAAIKVTAIVTLQAK